MSMLISDDDYTAAIAALQTPETSARAKEAARLIVEVRMLVAGACVLRESGLDTRRKDFDAIRAMAMTEMARLMSSLNGEADPK